MIVDTKTKNYALVSLNDNPNQVITLDANFLIPPNRNMHSVRGIPFSQFQTIWLNPIFKTFPNLAIHEAVFNELVSTEIRFFVQGKERETPPKIRIHNDSNLTSTEKVLRDSIEAKIYPYTQYDPQLDNHSDRGEVKTLAYIAVKGLLYFAAHDYNALQLVEMAESWSTGLDTVKTIKMYEIIYFLYVRFPSSKGSLRILYKYQYHLTNKEKAINPEWGVFIREMELLYQSHLYDVSL